VTKPEDLIEYILLQYLGSLDFISNRLSKVRSASEIKRIGDLCVIESALSYGYKTNLRYDLIKDKFWRYLSAEEVFDIQSDPLFGQKISFDIDEYRDRIAGLKDNSASFRMVTELVEDFGKEGFSRALAEVASQHKWEPAPTDSDAEQADTEAEISKTSSLSQKEIESLISDIGKIPTYVDDLALDQNDRAQVGALASAALSLAQSPTPPWHLIKELLYLIAAVSTSLGFVLVIAEKIF